MRSRGPKGYMLGLFMFACLVIGNQIFLFLYEDVTFHSTYNDIHAPDVNVDEGLVAMKSVLDSRYKQERINQFMIGKQGGKTKSCVMTISPLNNFGFVWNLYDSIKEHSPSVDCFIWFVGDTTTAPDERTREGRKEIENKISAWDDFHMVTIGEVEQVVPEFLAQQVAFKFERIELQTTMKPFAFMYAFNVFKADQVIFLDNDIWVTSSLGEIQYELSRRSCVLTPHSTTPIPEDGKMQRDKNILASGVYNFGFVGFSNTPQTAAFLDWWGERLNLYGFVRPEDAMFYDQNWGMFIPALFDHEDHIILRDFRYNIAYWNLHETGPGLSMKDKIPMQKNPATGRDEPVVFMHFSGMSLLEEFNMNKISKHQNRFTLNDFPSLGEILVTYMKRVEAFDTLHYRKLTFGYGSFSDGSKVQDWMREVYASLIFPYGDEDIQLDEEPPYSVWLSPWLRVDYNARVDPDPFCADESCLSDKSKITFIDWLLEVHPTMIVNMEGEYYFSYLEYYFWSTDVSLQVKFGDPAGADYYDYKVYFINTLSKDKKLGTQIFERWREKYEYHRNNHNKFHTILNENDTLVGMNIIGWHAGQWGVAISGAQIVRAAITQGIPINAITDAVLPKKKFMLPEQLDFPLTRSASEPVNLGVLNADMVIPLLNEYPEIVWERKYNIGYWAWELDVFPIEWMKLTEKFDEIWTPSSFIKRSIESSPIYDGIPVKVLAIPLEPLKEEEEEEDEEEDEEIESVTLRSLMESHKDNKPFVFLTTFDFASFVDRKNPKATIKAFVEAFADTDENVLLIVKSHSGTIKDMKKMKKVAAGESRVFFLDENLSDADNKALQNYQDCFVSLHRSEGYGMNILETMGKGIPVITTNYSGNVEFFHPLKKWIGQCHFPVPYKLVKLKKTTGPYKKGNRWADADVKYAVGAMRKVINEDCKNLYGQEMSDSVHREFGPATIGQIIKRYMSESLPAILEKQNKVNTEEQTKKEKLLKDALDGYKGVIPPKEPIEEKVTELVDTFEQKPEATEAKPEPKEEEEPEVNEAEAAPKEEEEPEVNETEAAPKEEENSVAKVEQVPEVNDAETSEPAP